MGSACCHHCQDTAPSAAVSEGGAEGLQQCLQDEEVLPTVAHGGSAPSDAPIDTQSVNESFEQQSERIVERHRQFVRSQGFRTAHSMTKAYGIFNVNLNSGTVEERRRQLVNYFNMCVTSQHMVVTLSCFAAWSEKKKINGAAKIIPAVPKSHPQNKVRVFFFDDNLDLVEKSGTEDSGGICNLRDIETGEFVNFRPGDNGFICDRYARHTLIHHSTEYNTVLVQANILDAMEDKNYFLGIVNKYAKPGEKCVCIMDVNSTIICTDSVSDKDMSDILLSTMFEFIELIPDEKFELTFEDKPPLKIDKRMSLKQMAKKIAKDDKAYYKSFYDYERCLKFIDEVIKHGYIKWITQEEKLTPTAFSELYEEYLTTIVGGATNEGITNSWFVVYKALQAHHHSVVINSFGVDTRKVTTHTVADEREVLQLTVNFELWEKRDVEKFQEQYGCVMMPIGEDEVVVDKEPKFDIVQSMDFAAVVQSRGFGPGKNLSGDNDAGPSIMKMPSAAETAAFSRKTSSDKSTQLQKLQARGLEKAAKVLSEKKRASQA
mmetsp:Transcript_12555/g.28353  ORF Transcript_12555/g.28353 Transcript_12555/m.28353 type:complete len:546 (+) Transcript_12555:124-1761(+)